MRTIKVIGTAATLTLAMAATASATNLNLSGQVVGQPKSKAKITVHKNGQGNLTQIRSITFQRVAAQCSDGSSGAISGSDPRTFAIHGKNFTRKTRVLGSGIKHGYFKATGKFRRGGKAVKGNVRFAFKTTSGAGCGTGKVRWRAEK